MAQSHLSLTVAGLGGDSGKTFVSLGLAAAWAGKGYHVAPFKKGPDYIDAAWLALATGQPCRNLDSFLMTDAAIHRRWDGACAQADICLIEGNRGLHDGMDVRGTHSTAALATQLNAPVLLVVDATKTTRTLAAIVQGVVEFEDGVPFAGVVLNRVGGSRHERVAREAIETYTDLPVIGAIPRLKKDADLLPGRHLGLLTVDEHPRARASIDRVREVVEESLDLDSLLFPSTGTSAPAIACLLPWQDAPATDAAEAGDAVTVDIRNGQSNAPSAVTKSTSPVRIGVIRDSAFSFYYPENLEELEQGGAELVRVDSLNDSALPAGLDALYIGGGFPETHAARLAGNQPFLQSIKVAAEAGLPVYAECGGLMLLCRELAYDGDILPMAGVFPFRAAWSRKPAGHGYMRATVDTINPFYPRGLRIRGHEFHHSRLLPSGAGPVVDTVLALEKGAGIGQNRDGIALHNVLALYMHVHASGTPEWAEGMLGAARRYKQSAEQSR